MSISLICVYNNPTILSSWLVKSLERQSIAIEKIMIDNTNNQFPSAAKALNFGAKHATNEFLFFAHQDIDFITDTWFDDVEKILKAIPNLGIAGLAGTSEPFRVWTNIQHGIPPATGDSPIYKIKKVQTVDECLFIIPKKIFDLVQFDEETCNDWHLYAVDYCLSVKKLGYEVFILPLSLYHRSSGFSMSETYYHTLKNIIIKHRRSYFHIYTTMGDWFTYIPIFIQRSQFWLLAKRIMHRFTRELKNIKFESI